MPTEQHDADAPSDPGFDSDIPLNPPVYSEGLIFDNPAPLSFTFSGAHGALLTITAEGELKLGEGLSKDEATQLVAQSLINQFGVQVITTLKEKQDEINRLRWALYEERGLSFHRLREANVNRQLEWDTGTEKLSPTFRAVEHSSELGEVADAAIAHLMNMLVANGKVNGVVQKLERERLGIPGKRATLSELCDEIADLVITADLLALTFDLPLGEAVTDKFNKKSEQLGFKTRL